MTVGFDATAMTVSEGDGVAVAVTLQQDVAVPVTVDINAVSGTAVDQRGQYVLCASVLTSTLKCCMSTKMCSEGKAGKHNAQKDTMQCL